MKMDKVAGSGNDNFYTPPYVVKPILAYAPFIEACKNLIEVTGRGEIRRDENGNKYAHDWGCRWFPTLEEAQKSCG